VRGAASAARIAMGGLVMVFAPEMNKKYLQRPWNMRGQLLL
jgi:hypothetical protein